MTTNCEKLELRIAIFNTPSGDVVEIGSATGRTTVILAEAALRVNKCVYSVDPYPENLDGKAEYYYVGSNKKRKAAFARRISKCGYTNITQFNEYLRDCIHLLPDSLSVVFIDSLHEFEPVKEELELIYPKVVAGGKVYVHDISWTLGEISQTEETGLCHIVPVFLNMKWRKIIQFENMICGIK